LKVSPKLNWKGEPTIPVSVGGDVIYPDPAITMASMLNTGVVVTRARKFGTIALRPAKEEVRVTVEATETGVVTWYT
jgi:hypothetical protein